MRYTIEDARELCVALTHTTMSSLNIAEEQTPYLSEVCDTDVDNVHNCLNIWLSLYQDITGYDPSILYGYIKQRTIVSVILEAKELRLSFIQSNFDYSIFQVGTPWFTFSHRFAGTIPVEGVLLILGFPKRLHFTKANLGKYAIEKFLDTNKVFSDYKLERMEGHEFSQWHFSPTSVTCSTTKRYTRILSSEIDFLNHSKLSIYAMLRVELAKLYPPKVNLDSFILPPGSTYELKLKDACYLNKYIELSKGRKFIQQFIDLPDDYFADICQCSPRFVGRLMSVPKDVGAFRTVMPEEVTRQFIGYCYHDFMSRFLRHERAYTANMANICSTLGIKGDIEDSLLFGAIDITNQERNQLAAQLGSVTNMLATMDLSSASDTISVDLCKRVLPRPDFDFLNRIRATHIEVDGKTYRSNIMFTMGFSATFITESRIYTAAGRVAVKLTWNWASPEERQFFKNINRALACTFSYGDDVIIPSFAADAFRMICEMCGFKINVSKSYFCGKYRESCGKEYFDGKDITVNFFPRGTSSTRLAELIGLQHKLYMYPTTNAFIIEKCGIYRPHLTFNSVNTPYMDIWSPMPVQEKYLSPYALEKGILRCTDAITGEVINLTVKYKDYTYYYKDNPLIVEKLSYTIDSTSIRLFAVYPYTKKKEKIATTKDSTYDRYFSDVTFIQESCTGIDGEGYSQVTVPQVEYKDVQTSAEALDHLERLAYVMRLYDMYRRPAMTSDEYLQFIADRYSTGASKTDAYGSDFGIIDYAKLRKSLTSKSLTKLTRRFVRR